MGLTDIDNPCVSLPRYAEIMEIPECWLWGVNDGTEMSGACDHIWTNNERKRIARYLKEAQTEIEQVVQYPLCPTWFDAERHPYVTMSIFTKWGKILDTGFRNSTLIDDAVAVNYAADPATVTVATTVTDEDEIKVYYPGLDREIKPDGITIAGGNAVITIPWCRLVDPTNFNNPDVGWDYSDPTVYTTTVDVYRVFNDHSIEAGLIYPHRNSSSDCTCGCHYGCATCDPYTENACEYIRNAEIGVIDVLPASYTSYWTAACPVCYCTPPEYVHLNYKAGLESLTGQIEDAVIRLAHSKMPMPPCGCNFVNEFWARDRKVPDTLDTKRLDCPFGTSDGAWFAWKQALAIRLQRGMAM